MATPNGNSPDAVEDAVRTVLRHAAAGSMTREALETEFPHLVDDSHSELKDHVEALFFDFRKDVERTVAAAVEDLRSVAKELRQLHVRAEMPQETAVLSATTRRPELAAPSNREAVPAADDDDELPERDWVLIVVRVAAACIVALLVLSFLGLVNLS